MPNLLERGYRTSRSPASRNAVYFRLKLLQNPTTVGVACNSPQSSGGRRRPAIHPAITSTTTMSAITITRASRVSLSMPLADARAPNNP
jgi:hypothetical protein